MGRAHPLQPATKAVWAAMEPTVPRGTTERKAEYIRGGSSIGAIGCRRMRESTVLTTALFAAALLVPSGVPSGAVMGAPSRISGRRVNATLAAPAVTTAAYGTAILSRLTHGGPASMSLRAPSAMEHETPTANAYAPTTCDVSMLAPERFT
eukprot:CAMPEP_0181248020 /NCGR_PEP_ID=MMETSP1096-20121128/44937_1 /TAXON_ID=156174 ORGANISM="Chrysochromulina ericina, Strain CCMP281" /NCGR_SAMPLE_ID=MMETSP1096 /ASSEMBLY_ACC=CAM_ASM_000453 /LENGTH=150 /DNA_ID=CAMNT_0023345141 /DNA_START=420 /DNA_END=872 /DNA_ORIENTATION=-